MKVINNIIIYLHLRFSIPVENVGSPKYTKFKNKNKNENQTKIFKHGREEVVRGHAKLHTMQHFRGEKGA